MANIEDVDRVERILGDHRDLLQSICCIRDWTRAVSEWGMPRFGELGSRLAPFRDSLALHFADEESGKYLRIVPEHEAQTMKTLCEQHRHFLKRLDQLIAALRAPEPEYHSWKTAVEQVESLINDLCDHEQQDAAVLQNEVSEASAENTGAA